MHNSIYSHGKSNGCGVLISFLGRITYTVKKKVFDKHGRTLIIEALIDNIKFILIYMTLHWKWSTIYLFGTDKPVRKFQS